MIRALWWKAIVEARTLLACSAAVLFGFAWLFVWLASMFEREPLLQLLDALPTPIERLSGMPLAQVVTPEGRVSVLYIDPVIIVVFVMWAIARGSDVVSGELGRGTMEILLAQPVRRVSILLTQGVVTTVGVFALAVSLFLGTWVGLEVVASRDAIPIDWFIPAALNVFSLGFAMCGIATFLSSLDRYRVSTVSLAGGFFVVQFIMKMVARMWPDGGWIAYLTIFGAFEPQVMVVNPDDAWRMTLDHDGVLLLIGLFSYVAAGVVFCRRDLPAPL